MEFLKVIVAALAGFGVGAVWYTALSRPWMEAAGIPRAADGRPSMGTSPLPFAVALFAELAARRPGFVPPAAGGPPARLLMPVRVAVRPREVVLELPEKAPPVPRRAREFPLASPD